MCSIGNFLSKIQLISSLYRIIGIFTVAEKKKQEREEANHPELLPFSSVRSAGLHYNITFVSRFCWLILLFAGAPRNKKKKSSKKRRVK